MSSNSNSGNGGGSVMILFFAAVRAFCSYAANHSVAWAIIHACTPFYLIYLCMGFGGGFDGATAILDRAFSSQPAPVVAPASKTDEK